jgi:hypothetical protein
MGEQCAQHTDSPRRGHPLLAYCLF